MSNQLTQALRVARAAAEFQKFFRETYGDEVVRCPHIRKLFEELDAWNKLAPKTLTSEQVEALKSLGWDFLPTGPNEWDWLKFDVGTEVIARGGDPVWSVDLAKIGATA